MFEDLFAVLAFCIEGLFLVDCCNVIKELGFGSDAFSTEVADEASPVTCCLVIFQLV